ncbi:MULTISPECIES: methylated-DNA--[protein]-cysteine S-methyltransferase [unclassified Rhodococcus (in: high G+C Gram-positive bacteria)]|uniref:methylated-DNA--[protein]-cysteine S-methyltransferase n=1 Tax=unclassified Rhodococcus (in: high G+C Gram-positive bacteria) TaxID=192944 RepID=UPI000ABD2F40
MTGALDRVHTVVATPVGDLTLVRAGSALAGVYFPAHKPAPAVGRLGLGSSEGFEEITTQLSEYFAGDRRRFELTLDPVGTEFQQSVWAALRTIPYGETWTYSDLARAIGRPTSVRAVASANARNPLSIVVPCHRVIGMSGSLTGFAGGVERKRLLLDLESGSPTLFG